MGRRIESLEDPAFGALFTGFLHTAYRFEQMQAYDVGYENLSYRRYLAGEPASDPAQDEWTGMVRDAVRTGKTFQRVHLVSEPLTDYLRYEIAVWYPLSTGAGEDIRILPTPLPGVSLPEWDYWLFDSRHLWIMEYDSAGRFLGIEEVTDPGQIVKHAYWRDAALHHAMRFSEYAERVQQQQRAS
jgi:hypothetical protein